MSFITGIIVFAYVFIILFVFFSVCIRNKKRRINKSSMEQENQAASENSIRIQRDYMRRNYSSSIQVIRVPESEETITENRIPRQETYDLRVNLPIETSIPRRDTNHQNPRMNTPPANINQPSNQNNTDPPNYFELTCDNLPSYESLYPSSCLA